MRSYVKTVLPPGRRSEVLRSLAALPVAELASMNPVVAEHEVEATIERLRDDEQPASDHDRHLRVARQRAGDDADAHRRRAFGRARHRDHDPADNHDRRPSTRSRDRSHRKRQRFRRGTRNGATRSARRLRGALVQRPAERTRKRPADRRDLGPRRSARRLLQRALPEFRRASGGRRRRYLESAAPRAAGGAAARSRSTKTFAATSTRACANCARSATTPSCSRWPG